MTEPKKHNGETHTCCNTRLEKDGGQARCCYCVPHDGCEFTALPTPDAPTGNYFQYRPKDVPKLDDDMDAPTDSGWEERVKSILNEVEFLHGVPVAVPKHQIDAVLSIARLALAEQKARMVEEVGNSIEDYFTNLIHIPNPPATKNALKEYVIKALSK